MNAAGHIATEPDRARTRKAIRELNDKFRTSFAGGRIVLTAGVAAHTEHDLLTLLHLVRSFDAFTADDDPYEEHDFGAIDLGGEKCFWKIDYYNRSMDSGSGDPADPAATTRVLTIMRADEY